MPYFKTSGPSLCCGNHLDQESFDTFVTGYIGALFFADTGKEGQPPCTAPLGARALASIKADCMAFLMAMPEPIHDFLLSAAGSDFWFTRQGHGIGFWDGDWPREIELPAVRLSALAGEAYIDLDDAGAISHYSPKQG